MMVTKALIIAGQTTETDSSLARSLLRCGALSLLKRQLYQLKSVGITEVNIITDWYIENFEEDVKSCTEKPSKTLIHRSKQAIIEIGSALKSDALKGQSWLIIEEGVLLDDRILNSILLHKESNENKISNFVISALSPTTFHSKTAAIGTILDYKDKQIIFASAAKIPASVLFENLENLVKLDKFAENINHFAQNKAAEFLDIASIPLFIKKHNREFPVIWLPLSKKNDTDIGTKALIQRAQKTNLEWSVWYLHRPLQNYLCKLLVHSPIKAFHISLFKIILGIFVLYLFSIGQNMGALAGAIIVGILEGLRDKFSTISLEPRKLKKFLFFWNKILPCFWYFAMAYALSKSFTFGDNISFRDNITVGGTIFNIAPYIITACFTLFRLADVIQCEFFRRLSTKEIHDMAPLDQKTRRWGGYRNNIIIMLVIFLVLGLWNWSLLAVSVYSIATFFIHQIRIIQHIKIITEASSASFVKNFKNTKIL
jgi:hypothetical protein